MPSAEPPPLHDMAPPSVPILMGCRADRGTPELVGHEWGYGWKVQSAVLRRAHHADTAIWSAKMRHKLKPSGIGVVRPLRSSDGRYILGGWHADTWVQGHPAPRFDEIAAASLLLSESIDQAMGVGGNDRFSENPLPQIDLDERPWTAQHLFAAADQAAFSEDPSQVIAPGLDVSAVASSTVAQALELASSVAALRDEVRAPNRVVSSDMVGTTVFDGSSPAVVTEIPPVFHPHAWPVALTVVDGMAWGNADDGLASRWSHLPDFDEMMVRAVLYRLFVHALHPGAKEGSLVGLGRMVEVVRARRGSGARTS